MKSKAAAFARGIASITYRTLHWCDTYLPFGVRSVIGVLFMTGGIFGGLPLLGFWMLPLGVALVGLDIPWTRHIVHNWMVSLKARAERDKGERKSPPQGDSTSSPAFPHDHDRLRKVPRGETDHMQE